MELPYFFAFCNLLLSYQHYKHEVTAAALLLCVYRLSSIFVMSYSTGREAFRSGLCHLTALGHYVIPLEESCCKHLLLVQSLVALGISKFQVPDL